MYCSFGLALAFLGKLCHRGLGAYALKLKPMLCTTLVKTKCLCFHNRLTQSQESRDIVIKPTCENFSSFRYFFYEKTVKMHSVFLYFISNGRSFRLAFV